MTVRTNFRQELSGLRWIDAGRALRGSRRTARARRRADGSSAKPRYRSRAATIPRFARPDQRLNRHDRSAVAKWSAPLHALPLAWRRAQAVTVEPTLPGQPATGIGTPSR
jgi:hypothetical protein